MADSLVLNAIVRADMGKGAARAARRNNLVPGVIYGGSENPVSINVKFNELLKLLKKGRFMSTLIDLVIGNNKEQVICRNVQKNIVKDLPTHVDFMRLSENASINLFIPIQFQNQNVCPGIKKGGVLTVVRPEVELIVSAKEIPSELYVDLSEFELGDTINISNIKLPEGARPTITGRDFVIANIQAPSGLKSSEEEETTEENVEDQEVETKEESEAD